MLFHSGPSPWRFSAEMYNLTAASFDNPDFVGCVIHSYRHRNFNAPGEARFLETDGDREALGTNLRGTGIRDGDLGDEPAGPLALP